MLFLTTEHVGVCRDLVGFSLNLYTKTTFKRISTLFGYITV